MVQGPARSFIRQQPARAQVVQESNPKRRKPIDPPSIIELKYDHSPQEGTSEQWQVSMRTFVLLDTLGPYFETIDGTPKFVSEGWLTDQVDDLPSRSSRSTGSSPNVDGDVKQQRIAKARRDAELLEDRIRQMEYELAGISQVRRRPWWRLFDGGSIREDLRSYVLRSKKQDVSSFGRNSYSAGTHQALPYAGKLRQTKPYQDELSHDVLEPYIDGNIGPHPVSGLADSGAAGNFISKSFADKHSLAIDTSSSGSVLSASANQIKILGSVELPFSFKGETSPAAKTLFHVLERSVHDVIFGASFLREKEVFGRFAARVHDRVRQVLARRLCFLGGGGSQQYVRGSFDGERVMGIPDTGSDVMLVSREYARRRGLAVDPARENRIELELADGSRVETCGLVRDVEWRFGGDGYPYRCDFYVLEDMSADVVLSYDFLSHTEAFTRHRDLFFETSEFPLEDLALSVVRRRFAWIEAVKEKVSRAFNSENLAAGETDHSQKDSAVEEARNLIVQYEKTLLAVKGLSESEQRAKLDPLGQKFRRLIETSPGDKRHASGGSGGTGARCM